MVAGGVLRGDVLLEWYRYPSGPAVTLPRHAHAEYQFNINLDVAGGVDYRGAFHVVPAGGLAVVMPGEPHTPRDPEDIPISSRHLTLYVTAERLRAAAAEMAPERAGLPVFQELMLGDPGVVRSFVRTHRNLALEKAGLDADVRLATLLGEMLERHAAVTPDRIPAEHRAVRRARDHLRAHVRSGVSLAELARVAGLSPWRLVRVFREAVGVPPHTYLNQLRLDFAKRRLLAGRPVSEVAQDAGFYDLSHFSRHFKRYVGASPGAYAGGNNVHPGAKPGP